MSNDYKAKISADTISMAAQMRKAGAPEMDAVFMERVMPPFLEIMEEQRMVDSDPAQFYGAVVHCSCVMVCETLLNLYNRESQQDEIYATANSTLEDFRNGLASMLSSSLDVGAPN